MKINLLEVREATGIVIKSPRTVLKGMGDEIRADRECFWVLHLNTHYAVIEKELISIGILDAAVIHPREVFKRAILNSAKAIITVHNHPSGNTQPSENDKFIWSKLRESGEILDIEVLDNLIVTPQGNFYSEKESREREI